MANATVQNPVSELTAIPKGQSPRKRAWLRFRRNTSAMVSLFVLGFITLACLITLPVSVGQFEVQYLDLNRQPPLTDHPITIPSDSENPAAEPTVQTPNVVNTLFGYDTLGRSLFWRCLLGGVISLGIGLAAATISVVIGTTWGAIAGWFGGRLDNIMMRLVDILYGLPYVLMIILLKVRFEPSLIKWLNNSFGPGHERVANIAILFLAIGGVSWLTMARVIRGQVLSLKEQPFMEAARALGVPTGRILLKHLLPNLIGPIIVYATLSVPQAILQESFLSFLGIGVMDPVPSWGLLASQGVKAINTVVSFWWQVLFPCLLLGITLLCLNFIGDGLRDALDPRTQKTK